MGFADGRCDVLVVGAGPAGAAAATLLGRAGLDVVVLERARFPRDKTCGDAVSNGAVSVLDELGAGDAVRRGPHALVRSGVAVFPDGSHAARRYQEPGFIVTRVVLDDCLRAAAERAGAELVQATRVERLVVDAGRVCGARLAGGRELRAAVVIAADGYGSVAWPALGLGAPRGRQLGVSSTLYVRGARHLLGADAAEHFFEHDLPFGYAWLFPDVEGVANLGVYLRQDAYRTQGVALAQLLERFLARHPERFSAIERVGAVRTWSLPLAPAPRPISADGLLVVGDAASFIDPLTGEGIWQGLFSGMAAARVAAEAVRSGGGLGGALRERFERECQRAIARPSRGKALARTLMRVVVGARLYRMPPVRAGLRLAYERRAFEVSKA